MVSKPLSNYLDECLVMKERLHRVANKDQKRAVIKAVTSPEDRLGEDGLDPAWDSDNNLKLLYANAAAIGISDDLERALQLRFIS